MVEILDAADVERYEDAGVDCLQIGEPNSKNQALLNRLRTTSLPVIHKRGNSLDTEAYLLWVERMMVGRQGERHPLRARHRVSANRYTRNTLDVGSIAAFRYQLSCLPIAVDASHGTGVRDLVHPATLAGIMAGASVVLVEAHPNPLIAKSDGHQGLFPEQLRALVRAARETWRLRQELDRGYLPSADLEKGYLARMDADKRRSGLLQELTFRGIGFQLVVAAAQVVVAHLPLQHVARDLERARGARHVAAVQPKHRGDVARFPGGPGRPKRDDWRRRTAGRPAPPGARPAARPACSRDGRGRSRSPSRASATARSISFCSSRTLPGQSYRHEQLERLGRRTPRCACRCGSAAAARKRSARSGMSSRRSRSGGSRIGNAARR